jgi:putative flippase GtrA
MPLCRLAVIATGVAISFCLKYNWDKFLVFPSSATSEARKSLVFLLSSSLITSIYLIAMAAIAFSGASNNDVVQASWLLFLVGYLVKYMIDRRFAFGLGG